MSLFQNLLSLEKGSEKLFKMPIFPLNLKLIGRRVFILRRTKGSRLP